MSNAALASGLLLAVFAMALGFLPVKTALPSVLIAAVLTSIAALVLPEPEPGIAVTGCLASLVAAAPAVFWPELVRGRRFLVLFFSAVAGLWSGLAIAAADGPGIWAPVLSALLMWLPAMLFVRRGWALAIRVVTSWLLAVALLVLSIPYVVDHPGYIPDHRA